MVLKLKYSKSGFCKQPVCLFTNLKVSNPVMPIKKDDPNSEKEDLKKTRFFRNRRPKEDLY